MDRMLRNMEVSKYGLNVDTPVIRALEHGRKYRLGMGGPEQDVSTVWAWMLWQSHALEHGRKYGLGIDALVIGCSRTWRQVGSGPGYSGQLMIRNMDARNYGLSGHLRLSNMDASMVWAWMVVAHGNGCSVGCRGPVPRSREGWLTASPPQQVHLLRGWCHSRCAGSATRKCLHVIGPAAFELSITSELRGGALTASASNGSRASST